MTTNRSTHTYRLLIGCGLGLLLGCGVGAPALAEGSPLLDFVDQQLLDIGAQMQNAKIRLKVPLSGAGSDSSGATSTPMLRCCKVNLDKIEGKLRNILASQERMHEYYRAQHNRTAVSIVAQMEGRLQHLVTALNLLAHSRTEFEAFRAMDSAIRPWNDYRNGLNGLGTCCPIMLAVSPAAEGDAEAGNEEPAQDAKDEQRTKEP